MAAEGVLALEPVTGTPTFFTGAIRRRSDAHFLFPDPARLSEGRTPWGGCRFRRFLSRLRASDLRRDKMLTHRSSHFLVHFFPDCVDRAKAGAGCCLGIRVAGSEPIGHRLG